jgi:hypothetical protein
MKSIARKRQKWKKKVTCHRKALEDTVKLNEIDDIDVKVLKTNIKISL